MANPHLICPVPASTPTDAGRSRGPVRALPHDLLKEAAQRLGIMSLLAAMLWVFGTVLYKLAIRYLDLGAQQGTSLGTDAIAVVSALASLALFFYTRGKDRDPRFLLNLGLVYLVATAFALGVLFHWRSIPGNVSTSPMITWIGAVILMSAAIVPNSPGKTLAAGLIAASMNPVGMLIARARGVWDFDSVTTVLAMHYPDYMLVGVSVVIAHVLTRLGHHVAKAREMGSYRLVTMLGKGGMGEVWRASHRMLARDAAIKLIQPEILTGQSATNPILVQRRFEQEAKTTASLRSPHTVQLYDFGVTENGVFYYVMELLDGIDLETLVKRFGPQPPARVAQIVRQVCRSLAEAHQHGLIHRDIKPTNIFLCRMGNEYDFAKVLDFGLVKVQDGNDTQMTRAGAATGTPAYMAPELALGRPDIDGRTDLYGLGCVAYWLLTGTQVFEENGAVAMMLAHLNKVPVRPSERIKKALPESLEQAILMCLAKNPAERPAGADALARMIGDIDRWKPEDAEEWWRANVPEETGPLNDNANQGSTTASAFTTV